MEQPVILVAEDEGVIGCDLCDTVSEAGYLVEGPHGDMSSAMLAFQKNKPDLAILDVELGDGVSYPLAQILMDENVPIIFHSGRSTAAEMKAKFPSSPALTKPCPPDRMLATVAETLGN